MNIHLELGGPFLFKAAAAMQLIARTAVTDIHQMPKSHKVLFLKTALGMSVWERELAFFAKKWCEDITGVTPEVETFLNKQRDSIIHALENHHIELNQEAQEIIDAHLAEYWEEVKAWRYGPEYPS